jgi:uncharacterized membrane protein YhaH (DUF805 family)
MFNYFKKLFVGRINRAQFFYAQFALATFVVCMVLVSVPFSLHLMDSSLFSLVIGFLDSHSLLPGFLHGEASGVFAVMLFIPICVLVIGLFFNLSLAIRRMHDVGKGKWWNLLLLFPPTQIFLLGVAGQKSVNHFGEQPSSNQNVFGIIFQGHLPLPEQRQKLRSMKIYKFIPTIFSIVYLLAVFIFFFFQWVMQDMFLFPELEWAVYFTLLAFLVWAAGKAFRGQRKNPVSLIPLLIGIATILLIIYFPFTSMWLG